MRIHLLILGLHEGLQAIEDSSPPRRASVAFRKMKLQLPDSNPDLHPLKLFLLCSFHNNLMNSSAENLMIVSLYVLLPVHVPVNPTIEGAVGQMVVYGGLVD